MKPLKSTPQMLRRRSLAEDVRRIQTREEEEEEEEEEEGGKTTS